MKKLVIMMAAAFISLHAAAQLQLQERQISARLGMNMAGMSYKNTASNTSADMQSLLRMHLGAEALVPYNEQIDLVGELLFTGRGASTTTFGTDIKTKLPYIDLAVMGVYNYNLGSPLLEPYGKVGPYLGVRAGGKQVAGDTSADIDSDNVKGLDFGINLAIGSYINLDYGKFSAELRYSQGLMNIAGSAAGTDIASRNHVFQIGIGYVIGI